VTLYARGRDIEEAELAVRFNRNTCKWTILGQAAEVHRSDERSGAIEALKKAGEPISVAAIMAGAGIEKRGNADQLLSKMATDGEIKRVGRGLAKRPIVRSVRSVISANRDGEDVDKQIEFPATGLTGNLTGKNEIGEKPADLTNLSDLTDLTDPLMGASTDRSPHLGPPGDSLDDFY
jgi:hypothetical protein